MNKNAYSKFCNYIQNPALGSIIIAIFSESYKKSSITSKAPNILYAFVVMALLLNEDMRDCVIHKNGKKASNNVVTLFSKLMSNKDTFNNLHSYIDKFKSYTTTSIAFGIKLNIIEIDENANIVSKLKYQKFLPKNNLYIKGAYILGEYFANGVTLKTIADKLEVLF